LAPGSTTIALNGRQFNSRPRVKIASIIRFACASVIMMLLPPRVWNNHR
jgi:hypothetical protein